MLGGVGAGGQFAFHGRFGQHRRIRHQGIDGVDAVVEVVLDGIEVAVIGVADLVGNGAARDLVHIIGRHIQRADDRIQSVVDAFHDLAVVAAVFGSVGAGGQFAFHGRFGQHRGVGHQGIDIVDAVVEVVLDGVEIAVVGIGDLGRDGAARDLLHVIGRYVERRDHRIQHLVDALHHLAVDAVELVDLATFVKTALARCFHQAQDLFGHAQELRVRRFRIVARAAAPDRRAVFHNG